MKKEKLELIDRKILKDKKQKLKECKKFAIKEFKKYSKEIMKCQK